MPINRALSKRLKQLVDKKFDGVAGRFAAKAKVAAGNFKIYLEGKSVPGGEVLLRLSRAANVSVDWLLTGEEFDKSKQGSGPQSWEISNEDFQELFLHLIKLQEVIGRAESVPGRSRAKPTQKEMQKMLQKLQEMAETKA